MIDSRDIVHVSYKDLENKMKTNLKLWAIMFKIGLFTFGGGYAMIALLENEFVSKRKWLDKDEFLDMVAIAESTPGPVAINAATYLGYKMNGVFGSVFATIGVCIPSFAIIYIISLFLDAFLANVYVSYAFKGIQVCVIYLILSAGIRLFKSLEKSLFNLIIVALVILVLGTTSLMSINFSTIAIILICGVCGLVLYFIKLCLGKEGRK